MAYRVELAKSAEAELVELYLWVIERAPSQGVAWFNGLEQAIVSFERLPKRCRTAPESFDSDLPIRVLNYGRSPHIYRVFFTIDETARTVMVVHIRRGARQSPARGDLKGD